MSEITKNGTDILTLIKEMNKRDDYNTHERIAVLWLLGEETDQRLDRVESKYTRNSTSPEITRSISEIQDMIESVDGKIESCYKNNKTRKADRLVYAESLYKWVLGENDAYDELLN